MGHKRSWLLAGVVLFGVQFQGGPAAAQTQINVSLDFLVNASSAPLFIALEKGWYKQRGLDVSIQTSRGSAESVKKTGTGAVHIGVADASTIALAISNEKMPIKAIAVLLSDLPNSIISFAAKPVRAPKDLEGKSLAVAGADASAMTLQALFKLNGVDPQKVKTVNLNFGQTVPSLLSGNVDATIGFIFGEYLSAQQQAGGREIVALRYSDFGVKSYSLCLLANTDFLAKNPDAAKAFVTETVRGLQYARDNMDEAAAILAKNSDRTRELLRNQLGMVMTLIDTPAARVDGYGVMDAKRWDATQQINVDFGNQKTLIPSNDLFTNQYVRP